MMLKLIHVWIDEGHGGYDGGAGYKGRLEKYDVLSLADLVEELLLSTGLFKVSRTRRMDKTVSINNRVDMMNADTTIDLIVSLHRNAFSIDSTGTETLYSAGSNIGRKYANILQDTMVSDDVHIVNRGVKPRNNLGVLNRTNAPAILLENGFISNPNDNRFFDKHFEEIAHSITKGICICFGIEYERGDKMNEEQIRKIIKEEIEKALRPSKENDKLGMWANDHFINLNARGIEVSEKRFDDAITRGEVFALLARLTDPKVLPKVIKHAEKYENEEFEE